MSNCKMLKVKHVMQQVWKPKQINRTCQQSSLPDTVSSILTSNTLHIEPDISINTTTTTTNRNQSQPIMHTHSPLTAKTNAEFISPKHKSKQKQPFHTRQPLSSTQTNNSFAVLDALNMDDLDNCMMEGGMNISIWNKCQWIE